MARPRLTHLPHQEAERAAKKAAKLAALPKPVDLPACCICGGPGASFGYGVYLDDRPGSRHACPQVACRTACETQDSQK